MFWLYCIVYTGPQTGWGERIGQQSAPISQIHPFIHCEHIKSVLIFKYVVQQKIEALHKAVAKGSLREVQALLGKKKMAISKVGCDFNLHLHINYIDNLVLSHFFGGSVQNQI